MTVSLPGASLLDPLYQDPDMGRAMSDEVLVRYMVRVEVCLALAQAVAGVIPSEAAEEVERRARDWTPPFAALQRATERNGVPVAGLAQELRQRVGGHAANWVHWGATSQDILDTARGLQFREALKLIEERTLELGSGLAGLAIRHRTTVMTGRTLGQAALPITFGYKAASWLASLVANLDRLDDLRPRLLVVQLGGAVGTSAAFGERGPAVETELARRLDLGVSPCPWHTRREAVAELAGFLSLLAGGLGKMGQDVILLAQSEIGEVAESDNEAQGASSTMPQKHNPVVSPRLVVAARRNAALLTSAHGALLQEQERGTHGWHLEQQTLVPMLQNAAGALRNARTLVSGLVVRKDRMTRNVRATQGQLLAEAATLCLARHMGREEATARVRAALVQAQEADEHLIDLLARTETSAMVDWSGLRNEGEYLGSAGAFTDRVLAAAGARGINATTENE